MTEAPRQRRSLIGLSLVAATVVLTAASVVLFPIAYPILAPPALESREAVLEQARTLAVTQGLAPASARAAIRFILDDTLQTFLELGAGGKDSLTAFTKRGEVPLYSWHVRFFEPGNSREATLAFTPDGRLIGVKRHLDQADRRPELAPDSARAVAERAAREWTRQRLEPYRLVSSTQVTVPRSARVDRTFTWERTDWRVSDAPVRLEVTIAGDLPVQLRERVHVPQSFLRRFDEMRSANDFLASIAGIGLVLFAIAGLFGLRRVARVGAVRWRPAVVFGVVLGVLMLAATLNEIPASWFDYQTETSAEFFLLKRVMGALAAGLASGLAATLLVAAAEGLTREAFPDQYDWWGYWRYRGTWPIAWRVLGGYTLAAAGFAYVAAFYSVTRHAFGWWVPSSMLDDPNQIATPLPWLSAIANSVQAGVLEEAVARAIPLAMLSLWVGERPARGVVMAAGVVVTALVFGFAHANYPSWPSYSRGVELFAEAALWAVVYLRFGLPTTIIAHFVFDMVWFGIFALAGESLQYRITLAIVAAAILAPAIAVLSAWARRGLADAPGAARMRAWTAPAESRVEEPAVRAAGPMSRVARRAAYVAMALALVALLLPHNDAVIGPRYTATRIVAKSAADSALRAHGADPSGWTALLNTADLTKGPRQRFLRQHKLRALAESLATNYQAVANWSVRYVHTEGTVKQRTEEWTVRVLPDGRVLEVEHVVADDDSGRVVTPEDARSIARAAMQREGLAAEPLREVSYEEVPRPHRRDVKLTYVDPRIQLPDGASARVTVLLAGDRPVHIYRYLELPEAFMRADRAEQEARSITRLAGSASLVIAIVLGLGLMLRGTVSATDDTWPTHWLRWLAAALAAATVLEALNRLPATLASYDTAVPWSTFTMGLSLSVALAPLSGLFVAALCNLADGARRRMGIPLTSPAAVDPGARDSLVGGIALGLLPAIVAAGRTLWPSMTVAAPTTDLETWLPTVQGALRAPLMIVVVALISLPALVVARFARGHRNRILVWLLASVAIAAALPAPGSQLSPTRLAISAATLAVLGVAGAAWAGRNVASWLIAASTAATVMSIDRAMAAASLPDRLSAAFGALVCVACVASVWLWARRGGSLQAAV